MVLVFALIHCLFAFLRSPLIYIPAFFVFSLYLLLSFRMFSAFQMHVGKYAPLVLQFDLLWNLCSPKMQTVWITWEPFSCPVHDRALPTRSQTGFPLLLQYFVCSRISYKLKYSCFLNLTRFYIYILCFF